MIMYSELPVWRSFHFLATHLIEYMNYARLRAEEGLTRLKTSNTKATFDELMEDLEQNGTGDGNGT